MFIMRNLFRRKNLPNKRSILSSWFFSYVIVLMLIIVLVAFAEKMYMNFMMEDTVRQKKLQLEAFSENMDLLTEECKLFAIKLATDNNFKSAYNSDLASARTHMIIKEFSDSIRPNMSTVDEYYIYIKRSDSIINSLGFLTTSYDFYNIYLKNTSLSYADWLNEYLNCHFADYHVYKDVNDKTKKEVTKFCYTLPLKPLNGTDGVIVVLINSDRYNKKLEELKTDKDTSVLIYSDNGNRYYSFGKYLPSDKQLTKIENSNDFIETEIDGKKVVMSAVNSESKSWKYAFVMPYSTFWSRVIAVKRIGALIIILLTTLGILGVYLITRYNYRSLADIIRKIEKKVSNNKINTKNEYEIINHIVDVTSQLSDKIKEHELKERSIEISNLLLGVTKDGLKLDSGSSVKTFASNYFVTVVFNTATFSRLFESEAISDSDRLSSMNFIIANIFAELMEPYGSLDISNIENMVFLFSPEKKYLTIASEIAQREAEKTINAVYEYFEVEITCGISNIHEDISNICRTYVEALSAMNMMNENAYKGVFLYSADDNSQKNYYYSLEQEQRLISFLTKGECEGSLNQIDEIMNMNTNILGSQHLKQALLTDIAGTIMKVALKIGYNIDGEKLMNYIQTNSHFISSKMFISYVTGVCEFVNSKNSCHTDVVVENVETIISENFTNVNFNVAILADMLDISANYLSTIYKKKTNENLLDKIRNLRVEEAKRLITESGGTFEQIAKKSGFGSITTFNRVFKKTTGMSPSEFRDIQ